MPEVPTPLDIEMNRLDLLSRLAGDLSHEIKNPLHAMVINLELVRRRVEQQQGESALERVGVVEHEIKRVHELVNALLEALRPPRNTTQSADAAGILNEMMPLLNARARLARVDFATQLPLESITVALPPQLLRQIILNLIDAAVRRAGAGGAVTVRGTGGSALELTFLDRPSQDPADAEDDREPGNGAGAVVDGLHIARALAERAGGELRMDGDVTDGGRTMTLRLPRASTA